MGGASESCHEDADEADVGEVLDRTDYLLILMQGDGELVPGCQLDFTIGGVDLGHMHVGDIIPAHLHGVGMDTDAVLEVTLILIKLVVQIDVLSIGEKFLCLKNGLKRKLLFGIWLEGRN